MTDVDTTRIRPANQKPTREGPVVYWMQRDQRVQENWALLYAQQIALERNVPLVVAFNLVPRFGDTSYRQYDFMCKGLATVQAELATLNITFLVREGQPQKTISQLVQEYAVGEVVCDFNPLSFTQKWRKAVGENIPVALTEVDAHNCIPAWVVSDKQEFAAHTFRPKVHRTLKKYLTNFPKVRKHPHTCAKKQKAFDWNDFLQNVSADKTVAAVDWIQPGTKAGKQLLRAFIENTLDQYDEIRNDPTKDGLSNLSPYIHFGQISAQAVAWSIHNATGYKKSARDAFLEELIVRRELTDNYCLYNPMYDKVEGAHAWAQKTIAAHAADEREYVYTLGQFEQAQTHDQLWNAMQMQMITEGKMHGWCRMYWAKKILEWTASAQEAIDIALYLNDKYELDGSDPNGVVGVMWSICGVHDRAWGERPVFGKIRYMNYAGAKRKFDVTAYIQKYTQSNLGFDE